MGKKFSQIRIPKKTYERMSAFMEIDEKPDEFVNRLLDLHQDSFLSDSKQPEKVREVVETPEQPLPEKEEKIVNEPTPTPEPKEEPLILKPVGFNNVPLFPYKEKKGVSLGVKMLGFSIICLSALALILYFIFYT